MTHMRTSATAATILALLALAGCNTTSTTAGHTSASPTGATAKTLPNLVGDGLQSAQDKAQAAGFDNLKSHDALGGRYQIWDRDWKVCSQTPAPGSHDTGATVDFGTVKIGESCPGTHGASASATPAASPSPTHNVKPKPTSRPTPKPTHTPTHSSTAGTSGRSSGGASSGGVSDPGSGATAKCNDGTYSYAAHHQGACSHHGGVAIFYK
jgi:hypothetical protein